MSDLRSFSWNVISILFIYGRLVYHLLYGLQKYLDISPIKIILCLIIYLPKLKYFFSWNSLSREISCSLENAVLLRRAAAAAAAADVESFLILTPPLAVDWPSMFVIWFDISSDSSSLFWIANKCFLVDRSVDFK